MKKTLWMLVITLLTANVASAANEVALPAVGGYDVVAYFTESKAVRGSGFHTATFDGQSYLFSSKENKAKFESNPGQYLPQFGGWCAYGVSVGKKFHVDPTLFEIVSGKLYLNLDGEIQKKWAEDKPSNIKTAHKNWEDIKGKDLGKL